MLFKETRKRAQLEPLGLAARLGVPAEQVKREFKMGVSGESFANPDGVKRQDLIRACTPGARVTLIADPENRYDKAAVEVWLRDGMIGYLPRGHRLQPAVRRGEVGAVVLHINGTDKLGVVLGIAVLNSPLPGALVMA